MENTPTQTPITVVDELEFVEVSKGIRVAHALIDLVCFYIVALFNGVIMGLMGWLPSDEDSPVFNIMAYCIYFIYYFVFEATTNKTPAKFITKSVVVTVDNEKPTTLAILWRTLSRFIPFDGISFLGERGWHDSISKTKVVKLQLKKADL